MNSIERLKAYKFRIYPTKEQEIFFSKSFGCVRKIYNLMLEDRMKAYEEMKNGSSKKISFPTPAKYKVDFPFLKEVDSLALANAQLHLDKAYKNFFRDKSVGFPRFKSKKNPVQSYTTNNQNGTIALFNDKYIKLPKLKSFVRIKLHRKPKGAIKSATISRHSSGRYYVSLLCKEEVSELPKTNNSIGLLLGSTDFVILSNGRKIDNSYFTSEMEKKLKREQRKMYRRAKLAKKRGVYLYNAKNYQKQKRKVARLYEKVRNQRTDFLNKLSTEIIKKHDSICMENLNKNSVLRNQKLAKKLSDVSWSVFVTNIQYKADWYGHEVTKVDTWSSSYQICSECGHVNDRNLVDARRWRCPDCYFYHDLEVNASKNILNKGMRIKRFA